MRGLFKHAALLVAPTLLVPALGVAEQPPVMVAIPARAPSMVGWVAPMPDPPRMPAGPRAMAATTEAPGEAPSTGGSARLEELEIGRDDGGDIQIMTDGDALLRPVWDNGFWFFPPGGMTRYLISTPLIIDVDAVPVQGECH